MKRSDTIEKLVEALAIVQGTLKDAEKDGKNEHFRSSYSTLASVWDACRSSLSSQGLAVVQTTEAGEAGGILLETTLVHTSGQWISGTIPVNCDLKNPQAIGSALTYARRYGLAAMVGVCSGDDDGEAAVQPQRGQQGRQQPQATRNRERPDTRRDSPSRPNVPAQATAPLAGGPTTKEIKRFDEVMGTFLDRMNAAWIDRHTDDEGTFPTWVKDLANKFQLVGHMLKTAGVPANGNHGERMKAAAAIWLADEAGTARGWQAYVKSLADELKAKHAEPQPEDENQEAELVGASAGREPGSDDDM